MPVVFIEAPPGIRHDAKKGMVEKVTAAIDEGYDGIASQGGSEVLVFLREYPLENVAVLTRDYHGLQSENPRFLVELQRVK
jgi:phenylpyruvate tautomerase PptA (4-oxalocrotonate tautomerase family)